MKSTSKMTKILLGGMYHVWFPALLFIWVALSSTPAQAQPFAYVANPSSDTVSVIDTATNTVIATVAVGSFPHGKCRHDKMLSVLPAAAILVNRIFP